MYDHNLDDFDYYWKEYFKIFHIVPKKVCTCCLMLSKVDVFSDIFDLFWRGLTRVIVSSIKQGMVCFGFYVKPLSIVSSQGPLLVYRSVLSKITRDLTRPFFLAGFLSCLARRSKRNRDYS